MKNNFFQILKKTALFYGLSDEKLEEYFQNGLYRTVGYSKGAIIYCQDELCKSLDVVLEGSASAQKIDNERNVLIVNQFTAGDTLGENLLFSQNGHFPMMIVADTEVEFLKLKKETILSIGQKDREFLSRLLTSISDKTLVLAGKINVLSRKTLRQKIADYLIYEYNMQNNLEILLHFSKKELAERLGVWRTSLSRELCKMKADGLIEYNAKWIRICKLAKLIEISESI